MTIKALIDSLTANATTALPKYNIFQGTKQYFEQTKKELPEKIIVIEPPEKFTIQYRDECEARMEVVVYFGWKVAINQISQSLDSNEYIFDQIKADIEEYCAAVDADSNYFIWANPDAEAYNPETGQTVNNYAYVKFTLKLRIYG